MLAAEATLWLQPRSHRTTAALDRAMTLRIKAGRALDAQRKPRRPAQLFRRASIQRRLMLPELPAVEIASRVMAYPSVQSD